MAAYLKTAQPFYGVKSPPRRQIVRELLEIYPIESPRTYVDTVVTLWELPHREEQYAAVDVAILAKRFVTFERVPLYRRLIVEGAWWDFVDAVASKLIGRLLREQRESMTPIVLEWIDDPDMWLRRTAIISQLGHKNATDADLLFDFCRRRAHEPEFFIRKAIGWALRDYARTDPNAVREFVDDMGDELSGLSRREATKHL